MTPPADLAATAKADTVVRAAGKACSSIWSRPGSRALRLYPRKIIAEASKRQSIDDSDPIAPAIDRTVKLYIGGKQARPDSGYSMEVRASDGRLLGEAPLGNRKDIRNAVEAAHKATGWAKSTAHTRAQVLYYIAENLSQRSEEIARRLAAVVGEKQAAAEVSPRHRAHLFLRRVGGQV